ncbi:MAG: hypothetical protein ACR2PG_00535 [Hyphomicrobiaceae bacterium]
MSKSEYSVDQYVADIREIVASQRDPAIITQQIAPLARRLATTDGWLKDGHRECNEEQGFGVHLLHEEDNHDLAVFVLTWLPDRGTLPHNHLTWAVVAGIEGNEHETEWNRLDDGSRPDFAHIERSGESDLRRGDVSICMPDAIHSVWNTGDQVSISLHTYGRHINYTGRSEFDPEEKIERPYVVSVCE